MRLTLPFSRRRTRGFTLVEIVLVSGLSALLIGAAVMGYRAVLSRQRAMSDYGSVNLGSTVMGSMYGDSSSTQINCFMAPSAGRAMRADRLREVFWDDVESSSTIFLLPRAVQASSTTRPTTLSLPASTHGLTLDTPQAFRSYLLTVDAGYGIFKSFTGVPSVDDRNVSIFCLEPGDNTQPDTLNVRCIWEIDFVNVTGTDVANGTYGSVRRYYGNSLTAFTSGVGLSADGLYYDIFYRDELYGTGVEGFGPTFAYFEREVRNTGTGAAADEFRKAKDSPFYFIWWPDPATPKLKTGIGRTYSDVRSNYKSHYGQTSLFFVVPQYPSSR